MIQTSRVLSGEVTEVKRIEGPAGTAEKADNSM
jgi:hypothetical protein